MIVHIIGTVVLNEQRSLDVPDLNLLLKTGLKFLVLPLILKPSCQCHVQDLPAAIDFYFPDGRCRTNTKKSHFFVGGVDNRH